MKKDFFVHKRVSFFEPANKNLQIFWNFRIESHCKMNPLSSKYCVCVMRWFCYIERTLLTNLILFWFENRTIRAFTDEENEVYDTLCIKQ